MTLSAYLRRQADRCTRLSRTCYDLSVAEQLRMMGEELRLKAAEVERETPMPPMPHTAQRQVPPS